MRILLICAAMAAALAQGACAGIPVAVQAAAGAVVLARSAYCAGVTEAGKQATRDVLTAGVAVVECAR